MDGQHDALSHVVGGMGQSPANPTKGKTMKASRPILLMIAAFAAAPVFAQGALHDVNRNVSQQTRIESGLQSGQLTTREAARLERRQAVIEHAQANAMRDGTVSANEQARIARMQNRASAEIRAEKHDVQTGNPHSASSQRMQADVQRNISQQQRIAAGVQNGSLTNHEASRLERRQAQSSRQEFRAGRDGHVNSAEQARIQQGENRHSRGIHHQKHDQQHRG
jgi:hypothetical protein